VSGRALLLHYMRQLVRQQTPPNDCRWRVRSSTKDNIMPDRIGHCTNGPRGLRSPLICVHANAAEIVPEAWFHERPRVGIERMAGRVQHFADDGWNY